VSTAFESCRKPAAVVVNVVHLKLPFALLLACRFKALPMR
jgi:hypothetical protein